MPLTQAARTLLSGLIDYAGLFPPARLGMPQAVEAFARHRVGEHEWMLGRFICPASRLAEFSKAAAPLMPGTFATSGYREHAGVSEPWRLSVLIDGPLESNLEAIERFNAQHASEDRGLARADMIELKASTPAEIDAAMDVLPTNLFPHFEIPVTGDPRGLIAALAGQGIAAKIRTGGVTPDAFPTPEQVAAFLVACAGAEVPFKATAGLHHPVCGPYRLTYEPSSPSCTMHGFLNLFAAAALVRAGRADAGVAAAVLRETDRSAFSITDRGLAWRDRAIDAMGLARVRETFALSFGSCSFDEPVDELKAMGVL